MGTEIGVQCSGESLRESEERFLVCLRCVYFSGTTVALLEEYEKRLQAGERAVDLSCEYNLTGQAPPCPQNFNESPYFTSTIFG